MITEAEKALKAIDSITEDMIKVTYDRDYITASIIAIRSICKEFMNEADSQGEKNVRQK